MINLDWIVQIATAASLLITAITAAATLREYRLKLQAEQRQKATAQAEMDLNMLKLFIEVLDLAQGRGKPYVSEKAIEQAFEKTIITQEDFTTPHVLHTKLSACSINLEIGAAAQQAAIAALPSLAERYDILRQPAKVALETMVSRGYYKEMAETALVKFDQFK